MPQTQVIDPVTRTRVEVSYEYKPGVDYWAKLQSQCPAWEPQKTVDFNGAACTMDFEDPTTRQVLIDVNGKQHEWVMPFQQYVPAVDPCGNICPLTVATCRNPEDDGTGFGDKIIAKKKRAGWFMINPEESFQGLDGQEYAAFLCQLSADRKKAQAERDRLHTEEFMSGAEKAVRDQGKLLQQAVNDGASANRDVMTDMAKSIGAEIAKALKAGK